MSKKILIPAIVLMALVMLSTPVIAEPTAGQQVPTLLTITGTIGFAPPTKEWTTNGGVMQFRELYQPHSFMLTIGTEDFTGFTSGFEDGKVDFVKSTAIIRAYATYWIDGIDGGFAGIIHFKAYNFNLFDFTWDWEIVHLVAQGFGDFEGQTLMLSYAGLPNGPRTGYCLKG